jgi:hypothetical protein
MHREGVMGRGCARSGGIAKLGWLCPGEVPIRRHPLPNQLAAALVAFAFAFAFPAAEFNPASLLEVNLQILSLGVWWHTEN